ncbi:transcriptional repressor [Candidatus Saccharibacteria bacterium]|nr:transcriptional repressor [Candidatus Saccharibacteria bacterium]
MLSRVTKYSTEILQIIRSTGHITNAGVLEILRKHFPTVSPTTVHRVTSRLEARGSVAKAPSDEDGSMRYDSNTLPHDHFICGICGTIRDIDVAGNFIPKISKSLGGCSISGRLVIYGDCDKCNIKIKGVKK